MVGVTGTNGKTSSAHWIAAGLHSTGRRTAVLGTLGNGLLGASIRPTANTTPDAATLHEMLALYKRAGAESVVMEVSSHGIDQGRINGVRFRGRAVHQFVARPSRLSRHDGRVWRREGAVVFAGRGCARA